MRRTRHTRRRTRHKRKHRRRRTRRHHKRKRRTRHRRRRRGGDNNVGQIRGGYKEGLHPFGSQRGGKKPSWAVSDYPPGFSKFLTKDKRQWKKIKKHRKH